MGRIGWIKTQSRREIASGPTRSTEPLSLFASSRKYHCTRQKKPTQQKACKPAYAICGLPLKKLQIRTPTAIIKLNHIEKKCRVTDLS
jgi:hypothetical protein